MVDFVGVGTRATPRRVNPARRVHHPVGRVETSLTHHVVVGVPDGGIAVDLNVDIDSLKACHAVLLWLQLGELQAFVGPFGLLIRQSPMEGDLA